MIESAALTLSGVVMSQPPAGPAPGGATKLIIICCYLGLLLLLGLFASRKFTGGSKDYMLASHSIGPFLLLMSLFGTTMTGFALVGSTGESWQKGVGVYGLLASSSGIIHSLCFFVLGVKLWEYGRRNGYVTQIQFFRDRLDSDRIGLVLFPILVGLVVPYLLVGVIAGGRFMAGLTRGSFNPDAFWTVDALTAAGTAAPTAGGIAPWLSTLVICGVVLVYVFFGGMRGTAWANAFQTCVFMILGIVTFYVLASRFGGPEAVGLVDNMRAASDSADPDKLVRGDKFGKLQFLTYFFIPLSVGMFPHLFQHWLTAKRASSFKLSVVMHPAFIAIVWVPCVLLGVWATAQGAVPPTFYGPGGVPDDAVMADSANKVLGFLVGKTSPVLGGFLAAGVLAAIMSSLDSQFLCIGTMFTEDIAVHYGGKDRFTDGQVVTMARGFIIAVVAVTYVLSLFDPPGVFDLGIWCFSGFASLFPLAVGAAYWRRLTKAGAYACVLAAFGTWLWLFVDADFARNEEYLLSVAGYEVMPVTGMIAASTLAMVVVSLVTRPPSEATLAKFFGPTAPVPTPA